MGAIGSVKFEGKFDDEGGGAGRLLVIGLGMADRFIVGGMLQPAPNDDMGRFTYLLNFFDQSLDLGMFELMKLALPPGPC